MSSMLLLLFYFDRSKISKFISTKYDIFIVILYIFEALQFKSIYYTYIY